MQDMSYDTCMAKWIMTVVWLDEEHSYDEIDMTQTKWIMTLLWLNEYDSWMTNSQKAW